MDRRTFLKSGSLGLGGLLVGGSGLSALVQNAIAGSLESGIPWKFGVMADTQWSNKTSDPASPGSCAISIINAVNQQFIAEGVKFVVQVGDLVDVESWNCPASYTSDPFSMAGHNNVRTMQYRAYAAQALYDAGIGFFPLRGNHEGSQTAASELVSLYPQTTGNGSHLFGASIIPSSKSTLQGLSYAFDVGNVRIVMLDQFIRLDGSAADVNTAMVDQVTWVDSTLASRPADSHAFVMGHKNLIGQNHTDCLFGADPSKNPAARNAFIGSLQANKVGFYMGGHDHMHHRAIITSPDGGAKAEQIICASDSYKFYTPGKPGNDATYDNPRRETVVAQELWTIGYYIFTVDGPCVTVDFYSASNGIPFTNGGADMPTSLSSYTFYKRERFGYSLNGKQFPIAIGGSYTGVQDSYGATAAKILSGSNGDTAAIEYAGRSELKTVKTGWRDMPVGAASAILKLWGLDNNLTLWTGSGLLPSSDNDYVTDTYVLSLSYNPALVPVTQLGTGFCLAAKNASDNWENAVNLNAGGTKKLVIGAYKSSYGLGTYGIDPVSHTVWAVLNRDGEFVARTV
jgi:hypothetical protein